MSLSSGVKTGAASFIACKPDAAIFTSVSHENSETLPKIDKLVPASSTVAIDTVFSLGQRWETRCTLTPDATEKNKTRPKLTFLVLNRQFLPLFHSFRDRKTQKPPYRVIKTSSGTPRSCLTESTLRNSKRPPALRVGPNRRFSISGLLAGRGEFASARREMAQIPGLDLVQPLGLVGSKRGEVLVD